VSVVFFLRNCAGSVCNLLIFDELMGVKKVANCGIFDP